MNPLDELLQNASGPGLKRRSFLNRASLLGAATALGAVTSREASAQGRGPGLDAAIFNFALNLEYLEAEYYTFAVSGVSITSFGVGVTGQVTGGNSSPAGIVTIKANPQVPFVTPAFQQYATEIAQDERNHVTFIRNTLAAAGVQPAARPNLDLLNSFTTLAMAANALAGSAVLPVPFDPFANEVNFLLGAFIFEDVGVTAYKGASPLIANKTFLENAAGILGVEAYHSGVIRTNLFALGTTTQNQTVAISDLRDALDPPNTPSGQADDDQGVVLVSGGTANLVPADANSIAFSRSTRQVLNIVYGAINASSGLFFPNGLNGQITT